MKFEFMPLHSEDRRNTKDCPEKIPISMLMERGAQRNHGQTLQRLAQRGGLGAYEIIANLDGISLIEAWIKCGKSDQGAVDELNKRLQNG